MAYDFKKLSSLAKQQEQLENNENTSSPPPREVKEKTNAAFVSQTPLPDFEVVNQSDSIVDDEITLEDYTDTEENTIIEHTENNEIQNEQPDIVKYFSDSVSQLECSKLHPYHNHTFSQLSDDEFEDLKTSITLKGIIEPLLVRSMRDGHYEIIAGHNRLLSAKALEIRTVPCRIANDNLTDDVADEIMVCTNLNRRNSFRVSEMAKSIAVLVRARKRQGYRNDLYETDTEENKKTRDKIGTEFGLSGAQIQRYIRLTHLNDDFLDLIDDKRITIVSGVNLSYLERDVQTMLMQYVSTNKFAYTNENTAALKQYAAENDEITEDILYEIFSVEPEKTVKAKSITVKNTIISKYFTDKSAAEINDIIDKALAEYFGKDGDNE